MRLIRLVADPTRAVILAELSRTTEPLSPRQLVEPTGEPLGSVAYHVRTLARYDVLVQVREGRVRGAVEHFYRPAPSAGAVVAAAVRIDAALAAASGILDEIARDET